MLMKKFSRSEIKGQRSHVNAIAVEAYISASRLTCSNIRPNYEVAISACPRVLLNCSWP